MKSYRSHGGSRHLFQSCHFSRCRREEGKLINANRYACTLLRQGMFSLSNHIRGGRLARYSLNASTSRSLLARACLGYLLQILQSEVDSGDTHDRAKLSRYCAEHWMDHAQEAGSWDDKTTQIAVRLLSVDSIAYTKWLQLYSPERPWGKPSAVRSLGKVAQPLYYAAVFGLTELLRLLLLDNGADANAQGG
jgi:hypothetical protein